jgi:iron complex outermembrane recepter protein
MRQQFSATRGAIFVLLGGLTYIPAYAQTTEGDDGLQQVVVTAERRSENSNSVPMAIQALTGQTLSDLHVEDINNLAAAVPGFEVAPAYSGVPTLSIRGIGFNSVNVTATSTVGIYQDELAYPYPFMAKGPVFDMQRVEVLKGPQGTLYGRNTTAGLVEFVTNKPEQTFSAGVTGEAANYASYNFEGYLNTPINDQLADRVAFRTENSNDGWQYDMSRGDTLGRVSRWALRDSLLWTPSDSFEGLFTFSVWHDGSDTQAGQAIALNQTNRNNPLTRAFNAPGLVQYLAQNQPTSDSQAGFEDAAQRAVPVGLGPGMGAPRADSDFYSGMARLTSQLSENLALVSLTGYNSLMRRDIVDASGAPFEILSNDYDDRIKSGSEELRLEGTGERFHWLLGGYYAYDDLRELNYFDIGQNSTVGLLRYVVGDPQAFRTGGGGGTGGSETESGFANGDFKFTDRVKLTAGLRYGRDKTWMDACSRDVNGNFLPVENGFILPSLGLEYGSTPNPIAANGCSTYDVATGQAGLIHRDLAEDNLSGRLALDYEPVEGTLVYASIARGVKSADIPIVPANVSAQYDPARQERLLAYEAGIKSSLAGHRAELDLSGFFYNYKDKQVSSYIPDPVFGALQELVNIPRSHAYGLDGQLQVRPFRDLMVQLNAVYLTTRIDDYQGYDALGQSFNYDGRHFSFAPRFTGSVTLDYAHPVTDRLLFHSMINSAYQAKSQADFGEDPYFAIAPYGLLNARLGLGSADERYTFSIWGRNLADKYYWTSVVDNQNLDVRFAGMPRTFGATFSYRF